MLGRQIKKAIKKYGVRVKNIYKYPHDVRYTRFQNPSGNNGIVLVIHESNRLGASLLLLNIAKELKKLNEPIYIITRQYGPLNKEYSEVAPTQIIFTRYGFKNTISMLYHNYGYRRILFITATVGDWVPIAHQVGYFVVSAIHELAYVVKYLGLEKATKQMLDYSDKVVFSTSIAKEDILKLVNYNDSDKIIVRPQGIYFRKPSNEIIAQETNKLLYRYPQLSKKLVVIGVGNTSNRKGFDIFLQVASSLPEIEFLWAGKKENYYTTALKQIGGKLPENFHYLGQLNSQQLAGVYQVGDILLMSSRKDTLPSVIYEALSFGDPVIGSKESGGIVDVIDDRNGTLVNECNSENFVIALRSYLTDQEKLPSQRNNIKMLDPENWKFNTYVSFLRNQFTV